jgi:hypothetical protein
MTTTTSSWPALSYDETAVPADLRQRQLTGGGLPFALSASTASHAHTAQECWKADCANSRG